MSPGAHEANQGRGSAPASGDPAAERDARRKAREAGRGPRTDRPEVRKPMHGRGLPGNARLKRAVTCAVIVGIAVVIAAVMTAQGAPGWLIGLVVSVASLALAAAFAR